MTDISRRDLLTSAAVASGAILLGNAVSAEPLSKVPSAKYEVKPLPFNPAKLQGISEKLIVSHHDKNYAGAVKRLSSIEEKIAQLPVHAAPFQMGSLKREALIATNSMILHEYYFENLGGDGKIGGDIKNALTKQFGSLEAWEHDFKLTGQSLSGGSGWVILAYSARDKKLLNVWSSDHQVSLAAGVPILVMDMYEHAYQMDYGADANKYIDAFFSNIDWQRVNKRAENLKFA
ncbi:MAG: Fe-Mn family superoxide dismutase [Candidatus Obscuribacter sp.]|nr:Fe-Mn family superoxide dismutase [Candidatus Obscuribacter sp.]